MKKSQLFIIGFATLLAVASSCFAQPNQSFHQLDSITNVYYNNANYDSALVYVQKKLYRAEKTFGIKDTNYANSLNTLVELLYYKGKYEQGIMFGRQSVDIAKELWGSTHPSYAKSLNILAILFYTINKYEEAEPLFLKASEIWKETSYIKSSDYSESLNNLAMLYQQIGNYPKAEKLHLEALKIKKETLGETNTNYATSLNNLALLYKIMGNFPKAEQLYLQALKIRKDILGEKHPEYAQSLNNLAMLYQQMGNYPKAEALHLEALKIRKERLGEKHPAYAESLNNLSLLYQNMGNYSKAEPLLLEAVKINKETFGVRNLYYASSINNLALLYSRKHDYLAAEPLYLEAKNIFNDVFSEKHPDYASTVINLANLYRDMNLYSKAEPLYMENLNIRFADIQSNFGILSENEKLNYLIKNTVDFNDFIGFAFIYKKENPAITESVYNLILNIKGILLSSCNRIRDEINSSGDTALIKLYSNWQGLKESFGRYSLWSKAKQKKMNINLDSLEKTTNDIDKELSIKSKAFSIERNYSQITWRQVQQNLNNKDVAIEFFTYRPFDSIAFKVSDTTIYFALVLRKEDKFPKMLPLCTNYDLAALLEKTIPYNDIKGIKGTIVHLYNYVENDTASQMLYKLVWHSLDTLLTGKKNVYISLTGLLNKISFNALKDEKNLLLLNKYNLYFINNTRQLAIKDTLRTDTKHIIVLFGGINYDPDSTIIKCCSNRDVIALIVLPGDTAHSNIWPYLAGTLTEVNNINKLFSGNHWETQVYTGNNATEEAFKSLSGKNSPSILHISSHGFFFPEPDSTTYKTTRNPFKTMLNSLWRSGIILAGANYAWQCKPDIMGMEDGILTAYEVADCNLKNIDLVVLSACETGLGDIKTGEGVYGLQRAFQVAGAKAVIMSLWQVPDNETTELMTLFYRNYIKSKDKHDSFRKAQQTMAKKYGPYYWAAFVLME